MQVSDLEDDETVFMSQAGTVAHLTADCPDLPDASKELDAGGVSGRVCSRCVDRRQRPRPGEEELRRLYHEEGLTLEEIGERFGYHSGAVLQWMQKHGIERDDGWGGNESPLLSDEEWLREMLDTDLTYAEIGQEANRSEDAVVYWLKKHGIKGRTERIERPSDERLREMYRRDGMSLGDIAEACNASASTVHRWKKEAGIGARSGGSRAGNRSRREEPDSEDPADEPALPEWLDEGTFHSACEEASDAEELSDLLGWGDPEHLERLASERGEDLGDETPQNKYADMFVEMTGETNLEVN